MSSLSTALSICAISLVTLQVSAQDNPLQINHRGGTVQLKIELTSVSNEKPKLRFGGSVYPSAFCCLLDFARYPEIAGKLNLSQKKENKLRECIRDLDQLNRTVAAKADKLTEENQAEYDHWLAEQATTIEKQALQVLGDDQVLVLQRARMSYLACLFGYGRVLQEAAQQSLLSLSDDSLSEVRTAEVHLQRELKKRSDSFLRDELKHILKSLEPSQYDAVIRLWDMAGLGIYPEMMVAFTDLENLPTLPGDRYGVWGTQSSLKLSPDGKFSVVISDFGASTEFLINAIKHNADLGKDIELIDDQKAELKQILEQVQEMDDEISELYKQRNPDKTNFRDLSSVRSELDRRNEFLESRFHELLLPHQREFLDESTIVLKIRRIGIFAELLDGTLRQKLQISAEQQKAIRNELKGSIKRYRTFSRDNMSWYRSQLLEAVSRRIDRMELSRFFRSQVDGPLFAVGVLANSSELRK